MVRIMKATSAAIDRPLEKRVMATDRIKRGDLPPLAVPLLAWRERARLTQDQLAGRTGLGVRTIRRLERGDTGRPRHGSIHLLAEALVLSPDERAQLFAALRGSGHEQYLAEASFLHPDGEGEVGLSGDRELERIQGLPIPFVMVLPEMLWVQARLRPINLLVRGYARRELAEVVRHGLLPRDAVRRLQPQRPRRRGADRGTAA